MISGKEDATSGRKVCFLETSYNIWCISMAFFRSPFSTYRINSIAKQSQVCPNMSTGSGRVREHLNMRSTNPAEFSGKSSPEVLARMLVEHPCRHVLFCRADASEHLGTMGLGLCTALWTCSAVHKINTLYNFSVALCTICWSGKSWRKDIFDYGLQARTEHFGPFLCQLMQMYQISSPLPPSQKSTLWSTTAIYISQSF